MTIIQEKGEKMVMGSQQTISFMTSHDHHSSKEEMIVMTIIFQKIPLFGNFLAKFWGLRPLEHVDIMPKYT